MGCVLSLSTKGPEIAGQAVPLKTSTAKISWMPSLNSSSDTILPLASSTTATPHFSRSRCGAIGRSPKVADSRILERPTNA